MPFIGISECEICVLRDEFYFKISLDLCLNAQYHRILPSLQFRNENDWSLMISLMKQQKNISGRFFWGLASIRILASGDVIYMFIYKQKCISELWENRLWVCLCNIFGHIHKVRPASVFVDSRDRKIVKQRECITALGAIWRPCILEKNSVWFEILWLIKCLRFCQKSSFDWHDNSVRNWGRIGRYILVAKPNKRWH